MSEFISVDIEKAFANAEDVMQVLETIVASTSEALRARACSVRLLGPDGKPVKLIFLRRLPVDPFTGKAEWGQRCYGEPPNDRMWCGGNVFDVFSKSAAKAIDGTAYADACHQSFGNPGFSDFIINIKNNSFNAGKGNN